MGIRGPAPTRRLGGSRAHSSGRDSAPLQPLEAGGGPPSRCLPLPARNGVSATVPTVARVRFLPRAARHARPRRAPALALASLALISSAIPAGAQVRILRDVPVPTTGGARIPVDVWQHRRVATPAQARARGAGAHAPQRPADRGRPVALLVHGGGWHSGDKRQWEQSRWAQRLVRNGWIVVNANYRLACHARGRADAIPFGRASRDPRMCGHAMRDSIADVRSALRFTARTAPRWGGDRRRIVIFGASAGGQLAMLAASERGRPAGVRAVVAVGPPTNLTWVGRRPHLPLHASARQSIGCDLAACPDAWRQASPIANVRRGATPPTWIFNAEADPITSIEPIRAYVVQLRRRGIPVVLEQPADESSDCHGPIPCAHERLAGGEGDLFERALTWLRPRMG